MSVTRRFTEEKQAMNNELMQNEDFIRCSTMIAELLMKYKAMEDKDVEFEDYIHDSPEQIQKCLNCDKPECTNCLWVNV